MITVYHRPETLDEALILLARPNVVPLGGGTLLAHADAEAVEAVDLQALDLSAIGKQGNQLDIGATVTLQQLLESEHCPAALKIALKLEAPLNLRNAATVAGTLVACDGRSTFVTILLACDAKIDIRYSKDDARTSNIGDYLPLRTRGLITSISIPINIKLCFEYVSRTPADKPLVCAALAQWNSGRTRLALGGYGKSPMLAMDGTEAEGLQTAARNALHEASDAWASAEYRMGVAATLAKRCLEEDNVGHV